MVYNAEVALNIWVSKTFSKRQLDRKFRAISFVDWLRFFHIKTHWSPKLRRRNSSVSSGINEENGKSRRLSAALDSSDQEESTSPYRNKLLSTSSQESVVTRPFRQLLPTCKFLIVLIISEFINVPKPHFFFSSVCHSE